MKFSALLDVNVVALEAEDEVTVLLDLEAPTVASDHARAQASLEVVLDRSGSMTGAAIEGAKQALTALVRRLDPTDNFGLVIFDDTADVVVPAGALSDKSQVIAAISRVETRGMTDLSAGYLRALREIRRVTTTGGTVLIISDGHVNAGIRTADEFASVTATAYADGLVTSTLGYGRGYDETLLTAIARAGSGNHVFADDPDAAGAAIAGEVDGLLNKVVQGVSLTIAFEPAVQFLRLYNDLPTHQLADGRVVVELGDFYAEEGRKLLLKFKVPSMATLGTASIVHLELAYVELPALVEHVATLPINVNVVPGDEAAGRVPHPTVHSEMLFQEAQDAKRRASEAFERGDLATGQQYLDDTKATLQRAIDVAPAAVADEMRTELADVGTMQVMSAQMGAPYMSKVSRDSYHSMNRKRGRRSRRPHDE